MATASKKSKPAAKKPAKKTAKKAVVKKGSAKKPTLKQQKKDLRHKKLVEGEYGKIGPEKKAMAQRLVKAGVPHKKVAERLFEKYGGSIQSYITLMYRWFPKSPKKASKKSAKKPATTKKTSIVKKPAAKKPAPPKVKKEPKPAVSRPAGDDDTFEFPGA